MTENNQDYKGEYYKHTKKRGKSLIFLFFLLTIVAILFFAFYENLGIPSFTGNSVKIPSEETSFTVSFETNVPELKMELDEANFSINIFFNLDFILDGKVISLSKPLNSLSLEGFSGSLELDNKTIKTLSGKVSKITLEGVPIISEKGSKMKINLNSESKYSSIEFQSDTYLKELKFVSDGTITLKEDTLNLNNDSIFLKGLFGKFLIKEERLFFDGMITKLDISGEEKRFSVTK
jgi:hypothetical protein